MNVCLPETVEEFFDTIEKSENATLESNCIFSLSFVNAKTNSDITIYLAGKELLAWCFKYAKALIKVTPDKLDIIIKVVATGNKMDCSKLGDLFELGLKIVADPNNLNNEELFENFKKSF